MQSMSVDHGTIKLKISNIIWWGILMSLEIEQYTSSKKSMGQRGHIEGIFLNPMIQQSHSLIPMQKR